MVNGRVAGESDSLILLLFHSESAVTKYLQNKRKKLDKVQLDFAANFLERYEGQNKSQCFYLLLRKPVKCRVPAALRR